MILLATDRHIKHTFTRHTWWYFLSGLPMYYRGFKEKEKKHNCWVLMLGRQKKRKKKKDLHLLSFILLNYSNVKKKKGLMRGLYDRNGSKEWNSYFYFLYRLLHTVCCVSELDNIKKVIKHTDRPVSFFVCCCPKLCLRSKVIWTILFACFIYVYLLYSFI